MLLTNVIMGFSKMKSKNIIISLDSFNSNVRPLSNESIGKIVRAMADFTCGVPEEYCLNSLDSSVERVALSSLLECEKKNIEHKREVAMKRASAGKKGMANRWGNGVQKSDADNKCYQTLMQEKERKQEKEKEPPTTQEKEKEINKEKESPCVEELKIDFDGLERFFNMTVKNSQIPTIRGITGKRRVSVIARAREFGKEAILEVIENAVNSSFLNGAGEKAFVASFDWLFRSTNFQKVLEGNYKNRNNGLFRKKEEREKEYLADIIAIGQQGCFGETVIKPLSDG